MDNEEKKLFFSVFLPKLRSGEAEGQRGELLYGFKCNNINEKVLATLFPAEYNALQEVLKTKPFFSMFDKTNYLFEYFFNVYNKNSERKIVPGHLVGFKAERSMGKNIMKSSVRVPNGKIINADLEISQLLNMGEVNFNAYILVHCNTICKVLTEQEYSEIIKKYF